MKRIKLLVLVIVILISLAECNAVAGSRQLLPIETTKCDFEGHTVTKMRGNVLKGEERFVKVELDPQQFILRDGQISYSLNLIYLGNDWLFINRPLVFLIDGQRMELEGIGRPLRRVLRGVYSLIEIQTYLITPEQFKEIAYADCVRVKIRGGEGSLEKRFTEGNLLNYRHFYEEVMK